LNLANNQPGTQYLTRKIHQHSGTRTGPKPKTVQQLAKALLAIMAAMTTTTAVTMTTTIAAASFAFMSTVFAVFAQVAVIPQGCAETGIGSIELLFVAAVTVMGAAGKEKSVEWDFTVVLLAGARRGSVC